MICSGPKRIKDGLYKMKNIKQTVKVYTRAVCFFIPFSSLYGIVTYHMYYQHILERVRVRANSGHGNSLKKDGSSLCI